MDKSFPPPLKQSSESTHLRAPSALIWTGASGEDYASAPPWRTLDSGSEPEPPQARRGEAMYSGCQVINPNRC